MLLVHSSTCTFSHGRVKPLWREALPSATIFFLIILFHFLNNNKNISITVHGGMSDIFAPQPRVFHRYVTQHLLCRKMKTINREEKNETVHEQPLMQHATFLGVEMSAPIHCYAILVHKRNICIHFAIRFGYIWVNTSYEPAYYCSWEGTVQAIPRT